MELMLARPELVQTSDAWEVTVPARFGRLQHYRFQLEAHARRFLALFLRPERRAVRLGLV
jgi:hypothetical protein